MAAGWLWRLCWAGRAASDLRQGANGARLGLCPLLPFPGASPSPHHSHSDCWLGMTQKNVSVIECQVPWQAGSSGLQAEQICASCSRSVRLHLAWFLFLTDNRNSNVTEIHPERGTTGENWVISQSLHLWLQPLTMLEDQGRRRHPTQSAGAVSHSRHSRPHCSHKSHKRGSLYVCFCCSDSKAFLILVGMMEFDFKPSVPVSCREKIAVADTANYLSKLPSPLLPQQQISIFSLGARSHRADCGE